MKKIKRRAGAALLIAALLLAGLGLYVFRLVREGPDWVAFRANQAVYSGGVLNTGTVYDRGGVVLAHAGNGVFGYAEDWSTRVACLHVVGDYPGNIGTGALHVFDDRLTGYDFVNGTWSMDGSGGELRLSIDAELNITAYNALAGRAGAVAVYNYETAEVLCMVSTPSYDPNGNVPEGLEGVYLNRVISSAYTPGSVFKVVTLAAAIENIPDLYSRSFWCSGSCQVGGDTITCSGTHGSQTIEQAFANSCNCAFAELSLELGAETLESYAKAYGLLDSQSLSGISTASGRFDKGSDGSSDLAWSGIGQYNDLVCPYAMLRLMGAIAGEGEVKEPSLLAEKDGLLPEEKTRLMRTDTAQRLEEMLSYNLSQAYGTWNFPGLDLCAKSGTAEVGDGTSHAWFTGYLKSGAPLAFVVVVEHGGGGLSAAGSVANTVLQAANAKHS